MVSLPMTRAMRDVTGRQRREATVREDPPSGAIVSAFSRSVTEGTRQDESAQTAALTSRKKAAMPSACSRAVARGSRRTRASTRRRNRARARAPALCFANASAYQPRVGARGVALRRWMSCLPRRWMSPAFVERRHPTRTPHSRHRSIRLISFPSESSGYPSFVASTARSRLSSARGSRPHRTPLRIFLSHPRPSSSTARGGDVAGVDDQRAARRERRGPLHPTHVGRHVRVQVGDGVHAPRPRLEGWGPERPATMGTIPTPSPDGGGGASRRRRSPRRPSPDSRRASSARAR